jgi:transposase
MILDWSNLQIFIKPGPVDFRKQINGLSALVQEEMNGTLFSGSLFLFCNQNRSRMKILYWDKTGFCLWMKRLEKERFPWPKNRNEVFEINHDQLRMLLSGIDFFHAHQTLTYKKV